MGSTDGKRSDETGLEEGADDGIDEPDEEDAEVLEQERCSSCGRVFDRGDGFHDSDGALCSRCADAWEREREAERAQISAARNALEALDAFLRSCAWAPEEHREIARQLVTPLVWSLTIRPTARTKKLMATLRDVVEGTQDARVSACLGLLRRTRGPFWEPVPPAEAPRLISYLETRGDRRFGSLTPEAMTEVLAAVAGRSPERALAELALKVGAFGYCSEPNETPDRTVDRVRRAIKEAEKRATKNEPPAEAGDIQVQVRKRPPKVIRRALEEEEAKNRALEEELGYFRDGKK